MVSRIDLDREHKRRAGSLVGGHDLTPEDHEPGQESERPDPAPHERKSTRFDVPEHDADSPMGCQVVLISVSARPVLSLS
jgi:hypothetical protein